MSEAGAEDYEMSEAEAEDHEMSEAEAEDHETSEAEDYEMSEAEREQQLFKNQAKEFGELATSMRECAKRARRAIKTQRNQTTLADLVG